MTPELRHEVAGEPQALVLAKDEVTVGRAPDNDLVLQHASISRHHAKLVRARDGWHVVDVGSKNGTRIVDRQGDVPLKDGDVVVFGACSVTFADAPSRQLSLAPSPAGASEESEGVIVRRTTDFERLVAAEPALRGEPGEVARLRTVLGVMTRTSSALLSTRTLDELLGYFLDALFEHLPAERACIMVWDEGKQALVERAWRVRSGAGTSSELHVSRTIAEKVFRERVAVLTTDALSDERFRSGASILAMGIRSAMAAPLVHEERAEGIIYVDTPFHVKAFDDFDLDVLSALGNHAAIAIEQARLEESIVGERLVRQRLERYHSPAVVERIERGGATLESLEADEREVTVLFADVVGFTSRCERMEPRQVADFLNRCFSRMADQIFKHEGTLDKFIGDCVMAVFGAPLPMADHAVRGVQAALDMRDAIAELNEELDEGERAQFRIGINSGKVVAGDIGSVRRRDYTVLGATVNLASRIESSVAKPGQIVVSDTTHAAVERLFETRLAGEFQPKGISRVVKCYEVLDRRKGPPPADDDTH